MTYHTFQKLGYEKTLLLIELFEQGCEYEDIANKIALGSKATVCRYLMALGKLVRRLELNSQTEAILKAEHARREDWLNKERRGNALILKLRLERRNSDEGFGKGQEKVRA